jgi:GYF domain 2
VNRIFIFHDGQQFGPYSLEEVRAQVVSGGLQPTDLAWFDGAADWMPLNALPGLVLPKRPPPPPPRRATPPPPPAPMPSSVAGASPGQAIQAKQNSSPVAAGCGCLVVGFLLICLFGLIPQSPEKEAESVRFDAYYTASEFAKKQYPGIKTIAPYKEAIVEQHGNTYIVAFHVDGVNAFNAPIKRRVGVELELRGTTWHLRGIKEQ